MIAATEMTDITIPTSLGLSVLGMVIVFFVLVFLMVIIIVMTAIIRRLSTRAATAIGSADGSAVPFQHIEPVSDVPVSAVQALEETAAAESSPEPEAAPATAPEAAVTTSPEPYPVFPVTRKYRVIVDGAEYEVDAESGESVPTFSAPEPAAAAAPVKAVQAATAVPADSSVAVSELKGVRKYRVVVNGVEYEVDAETENTVNQSGTGRGL